MPKTKSARRRKRTRLVIPAVLLMPLAAFGLAVLATVGGFAFAASQEQRDSFCASCHTQPESTYFQRSVAAAAIDLASAHTVKATRCIDCHSGAGVSGRVQAELLGAHNALLFITKTAVQPAKLTKPIGDENCLKCHQTTIAQAGSEQHFHAFLARWQAADPNAATCVSCHTGHNTDGTTDTLFMNVQNLQTECQACHQALGAGG
jgi:hypothetical protein